MKRGDQDLIDAFEDLGSEFRLDELVARQSASFEKELAALDRTIQNAGRVVRRRVKRKFEEFIGKASDKLAGATPDPLTMEVKAAIAEGKDPNEVLRKKGILKRT